MKDKHQLYFFVCTVFLMCVFVNSSFGGIDTFARQKFNFNCAWKLMKGDFPNAEKPQFDDHTWPDISLPHAFNEDEAYTKGVMGTGIAWYRKHFKLPAAYAGQKVLIEFEGVRQAAEIYVNGQAVGISENGVMAFGFDITDKLNYGDAENVIAVRVDNSFNYQERGTGVLFQWNHNGFYANYGGINKNVYLHITGKLYQTLPLYSNLKTTGPYIYARDFDINRREATIVAETQVKNDNTVSKTFSYEVRLEDMEGKTDRSFKIETYKLSPGQIKIIKTSSRVTGLHFWSWGYGYLYNVYTTLKVDGKVVDEVKTRTGFRKTAYENGMVKLNDQVIQLKGFAQRTTNEWPAIGNAVPAWMSDYSNRLMVDGNANLVRWMHVMPWKQDVESCDRVGLIENMPAGDAEADVEGRQWEQRLELMRDAIIYDRNNPSILFYESGNKGVTESHMQDMKAIRDQYDPFGGRASGSREMLHSAIAEYGGEMLNIDKSAHTPFWAMEYSRDECVRAYWDELSPPFHKEGAGPVRKDVPVPAPYNHNQDTFALEDVARWYDYWCARPGTGKRVSSGGAKIIFSDSNTHFRGEENYRTSGAVDALRIPKDAYFAHQVMWDGWVDVAKNHMFIVGHWNYTRGIKKNVYVVSGSDKVELFVNGKSKGFGEQTDHFLFTFKDISWEPGILKAISYDNKNNKLGETQKSTTGEPVALKLTLNTGPGGLKADGADLALVDIEAVDKAGNRCPIAQNTVNFELSGPAEWRGGIGHGRLDNFILSKALPLACGINRVMVRSLAKPGKIVLRAQAEGLQPASITINSEPVQIDQGLSKVLPGAELPSNLRRGPTPAGPSYSVSRLPVTIAGCNAGSNANNALKSFDDNELTSWVSDGTLNNGWITYNFAGKTEVNEITLKLNGWRTQTYPIKVFVDKTEVFSGETEVSLGYVTIPFHSTEGSSLTIQLTGPVKTRDAFGIIEVNGQREGSSAVIKNVIGINEIEIYKRIF